MPDAAVSTAVDTNIKATELAGSVVHDMSLIGLFTQADMVVKVVMIGLLLASVWCWALIIDKYTKFKTLKYHSDKFEKEFWSADALDAFHDGVKRKRNPHPMAAIFLAAMEEWYRSKSKARPSTSSSLKLSMVDRIAQMMSVTRNRELDRLEKGLGFLATVGSAAPFIGLFGTVWGIMNSFTSIAASKNTSLAVVAPGIAEALFATAIGLFAAIPAVIAYNKFSHELARYAQRLDDFATEFTTLIGRQSEGA